MAGITVFGSCNMDLVVVVDTPPRRGETVSGLRFVTVPGGKGANQAVAAARAGGDVAMIGAIGNDEFGAELQKTLQDANVDGSGVRTVDGPSGTAHIVVDRSGDNAIVVVAAANGTLTDLADGDERRIADAELLLMQLEVPLSGVLAAAKIAQRHGTRVVLTPAPARELPAELLAAVDLLVLNEHEAATLTGQSDPDRAVATLLGTVPEVVLTLGARGCRYGNRNGESLAVAAIHVEPVDTTAAGDTFTGALAVALGERRPMRDALRWASTAAALSVQRQGASTSAPTRQEIESSLR